MGIIFGLVGALAWGLADFCARFAAHKVGFYRTAMYMQPIGFLGLSVVLFFTRIPSGWEWWWLLIGVALGLGNVFGGLFLYRAFEIGQLSIAGPIASSYGGVTLVLALASGQRPQWLALLGLVIIIVGVMLSSADLSGLLRRRNAPSVSLASHSEQSEESQSLRYAQGDNFKKPTGVAMALLAALFFGVAFWGLGYASPKLGEILPTWEMRLVGFLALFALAAPLKQTISLPSGSAWLWIIGVGVLDTTAFICYSIGLTGAESGIVAVLTSLFSVVTVILARLFLNERLVLNQWLGVALILVGIGFISAG